MARQLLLLNGLAILGVILFHAAGWGFTAMFAWTHRYLPVTSPNYSQAGTTAYYALRIVEQLIVFSIPAFLFVSGFFTAFSTQRGAFTISWRVIQTRIVSMLIPYLVWSTILWAGFLLQGKLFSLKQYIVFLLTGATNPAYYFVILLVQLYLLSPLIVPVARTHWQLLLLTTALVQIIVDAAQYLTILSSDALIVRLIATFLPKWAFLTRLFWFVFGIVFGFHFAIFKQVLERVKWILLGLVPVLFVLGVLEWELLLSLSGQSWIENRLTFLDDLYGGVFILSLLSLTHLQFPFHNQLNDWGSNSFGIYLVHSPVMEYFARGLYHFAPWVLGQQIIFQPALIVLGLGVPLLLMFIVRNSPARKIYAYVFG